MHYIGDFSDFISSYIYKNRSRVFFSSNFIYISMTSFDGYYDAVKPFLEKFLTFADKNGTPFTREITKLFEAHFVAVGKAMTDREFPKELFLELHACIDSFMLLESVGFNYAGLLNDTVHVLLWHERKFHEQFVERIVQKRLDAYYAKQYGELYGENKLWATYWFELLDRISSCVRSIKYDISDI